MFIDEQKVADLKELPQSFDRQPSVVILSLLTQKQVFSQKMVITVAGQQTAAECMLAGAALGFSSGEMFANAEALETALMYPSIASFLAKEV